MEDVEVSAFQFGSQLQAVDAGEVRVEEAVVGKFAFCPDAGKCGK